MSDASFAFLATVTAGTKRASPTTGYAANLSNLACYPLAPITAETQQRLELNTPHTKKETFFQDSPDIRKGDILVIATVEYPVVAVESWAFNGDTRLLVVVEDLRNR